MRESWILFFSLLIVSLSSCEESLPPRNDPSTFLKASFRATYVYSPAMNDVVFQVSVINGFDETLEGPLDLDGFVLIKSTEHPQSQKTITISPSDLIHGFRDPHTGMLILNPGDSVIFQSTWDFTDDLFRYLPLTAFHYSTDLTCTQRLIADPESFSVYGKVKLYKQSGYGTTNSSFAFRHIDRWIPPNECKTSPGVLVTAFWTEYIYNQEENDVRVLLSAKNKVGDGISGILNLDGTVVMRSIRDSTVHKTFVISPANLVHGQYNPATGALTIAGNDSVIFGFVWDFTDDASRDLRTSFFRYLPDNSCDGSHQRSIALPEYFDLTSRWSITASSGYAITHGTLKVCQIDAWVDPANCPSYVPNPVCLFE
ncbi:MAG TPA: hypothetical protein VI758_00935 [Bacteroidota bacterium]